MIEIIFYGKPRPWRAPFVGRRGTFSSITKDLRKMRYSAMDQYGNKDPIDTAVICDIIAYMPIPKSTPKYKRILMIKGRIRPTGRPDRINMGKLAEDALNGIVWKDDALVVGGAVEKWYCECPRIVMRVTAID